MSIVMVLNDIDDTPIMRHDRTLPQPVQQYGAQCTPLEQRSWHDQTNQGAVVDLSKAGRRLENPSGLALGELHSEPAALGLPQMLTPTQRGQTSRPPRYRYSEEEFHFLWYHKNDLGLAWDRIEEKYRLYFDQCRSKGGLQCKLYRILEEHGIPKLRDLNRGTHRRGASGRHVTRVNFMDHVSTRYEWMLPEHGGGARRQKWERDGRL
ncbi:hypothetical protein DV736_g574, partial [Chaetothyriales sp. CBS 134916]